MHTKMSLNVRHRVVSPAGIAERTCIYPNQAQTLARERVTRQPPTLDCGSTEILGDQPTRHWLCDTRARAEALLQTIRYVQFVRRNSYAAARW